MIHYNVNILLQNYIYFFIFEIIISTYFIREYLFELNEKFFCNSNILCSFFSVHKNNQIHIKTLKKLILNLLKNL